MPLHVVQLPTEAPKVAAAGLARIRRLKPAHLPNISGTNDADLALAVPHPVYALASGDIAAGRPLDAARQTRWRYLVMSEDRAVGGVEVEVVPDTGAVRFVQADEGWIASATVQAIRLVESRPEIEAGSFEVRLLLAPALYVVALWLKDRDARGDLVVSLAPAPKRFESFHPYSSESFLALLRAEAAERPAFDTSPRIAAPAG